MAGPACSRPIAACGSASLPSDHSFLPVRLINTHARTHARGRETHPFAFLHLTSNPPCAAGQRKGITAVYCYSSFSSSAATNVLNPPHACKRGRRNSDLFGDPSCAGWLRRAPPRGHARDTLPKKLARPPIRFEFGTRQRKLRPPRALTSSRRELETFGHAPGRRYYRWLKPHPERKRSDELWNICAYIHFPYLPFAMPL
jgi:hypothetical protein